MPNSALAAVPRTFSHKHTHMHRHTDIQTYIYIYIYIWIYIYMDGWCSVSPILILVF